METIIDVLSTKTQSSFLLGFVLGAVRPMILIFGTICTSLNLIWIDCIHSDGSLDFDPA
jgi:hypothetical protein